MKQDDLGRRLRHAPPSPAVARVVLQEPDFLLFEAIDRHGPLPTPYFFEFTKHLRISNQWLQRRLTEFYNGDQDGPYLTRPPRQFDGFEARYQHLVYDLAPRARVLLAERGTLGRYSPRRTDPFLHQLMGACVGASIELGCKERGLRYIPREEILTHPKCPKETRESRNPMALPMSGDRNALVPDDLFGIEYPDVGFRFFAVEIDRNTESIERVKLDHNSFGRKIAAYLEVLRTKRCRSWWGIPNLSILTVTTNTTHAANILDFIRRHDARDFQDRFLFAVETRFGANWRVPKELLTHLLEHPWLTVSGEKLISKP